MLFIADTLSAFALPSCLPPGATINWSKTPFSLLERNGRLPFTTQDKICRRFASYCETVSALGVNAVSVDDLAHLAALAWYHPRLAAKIADYEELFDRLCMSATALGLSVYVNTDAKFAPMAGRPPGENDTAALFRACGIIFRRFPAVDGVILRIGECDGLDVDHEMRSNLLVRTPSQARSLVQSLLPLFETMKRTLVVRTWTVGAFSVGDLMWNPRTYDAVFGGINSSALIVSHKYGTTDFFRYLGLNPLIEHGSQRKLVEFQARREYEGFGEFPSFTGDYYNRLRRKLTRCENLAGIMVWCQTGGWSRFRSATFMPGSSIYNEVNTAVAVSLFARNDGVEQSVRRFCALRAQDLDPALFLRLLRLSSDVIESIWYMPEFSGRTIFFRRTRVPPLLWVFWDTMVISGTLRLFIRNFIHCGDEGTRMQSALAKIDEMERLAGRMGLDPGPFVLLRRTAELLGIAREYFFGDARPALERRIECAVDAYKKDFPRGKRFSVVCDFGSPMLERALLRATFFILTRTRPSYRSIDVLLLNRLAAAVVPFVKAWNRRRLPAFVRERGMGFESLLR